MNAHAEQNQAADLLVTKCTNPSCGHTFLSRNPIFVGGNSRDIVVRGTRVPCERCGSWAIQQDWDIDSQGNFQLRDMVNEIRNLDNVVRLKEFQEYVHEAANDEITANELADALSEVDPRFAKFKSYIKSLHKKDLKKVVETLLLVLTLVITIASYVEQSEANELAKESNETQAKAVSIQQNQYELDKRKFEAEQSHRESDQRVSELEEQIEVLLRSLEDKPNQSVQPPKTPPSQPKCNLKGNQRNQPCFCGSGQKAKKCHPYGLQRA
ncbi:SEC-C domain-containing protein [Vibrio diabolicus]|uniref:SEC-C domain-containing protein n=1 Tax=Vibrio diabolicus TaxID=50719 RepID=UPI00215E28F6|nr:SEC-C domain-containing protein [Vibrio diabolicus]MCS0301516.1 SEC-C domain-containing protein [Vibrio diabolicus]